MNVLLSSLFHVLIFPGLLFCVVMGVLLSGLDRIWVARMQRRVGPPLLQSWYDFLKCCGKETIVPRHAKKAIYFAAPVVGFAALISISLFLPVAGGKPAYSGTADLVVILYLLTLVSVCMIVGASASGSPTATRRPPEVCGSNRISSMAKGTFSNRTKGPVWFLLR